MSFPLVIAWSVPRSRSTVFERVWKQVPEMNIFHESFAPYYYKHIYPVQIPEMDIDENTSTEYEEIKKNILDAKKKGPVFLKDMPYYCIDKLTQDTDFLLQATHIFLIRDPKETILSYLAIDPNAELEAFGFKAAQELHAFLTEKGIQSLVIDTGDLGKRQEQIFTKSFDFANVPFKTDYLTFKETEDLSKWKVFGKWHEEASNSTKIKTYDSQAKYADLMKERALDIEKFDSYHRPYYDILKKQAYQP